MKISISLYGKRCSRTSSDRHPSTEKDRVLWFSSPGPQRTYLNLQTGLRSNGRSVLKPPLRNQWLGGLRPHVVIDIYPPYAMHVELWLGWAFDNCAFHKFFSALEIGPKKRQKERGIKEEGTILQKNTGWSLQVLTRPPLPTSSQK